MSCCFSWLFDNSPNEPEVRGRGDPVPLPEQLAGISEFQRIWDTVTQEHAGIVGIHGEKIGLGLTTLLNYLNNQFLLQRGDNDAGLYDYVFICHAACSTSSIRDRIARQIGLADKDSWKYELDFRVKAQLVHKELLNKKYVLLMDEAESPLTPSAIGVPDPDFSNKSKFIFTTVSQKICTANNPNVFEKLHPLSLADSSTLFFQILGMENVDGDEFANVASQMVGVCFGLPKVIVVVAALMALNKNIKQWQKELDSMTELHHKQLSTGLSRFKCDFAEDYYFHITFFRELAAGKRPLTSDISPGLRGEEGKRLLAIRQWGAKYVMSDDMQSYKLLTRK